MALKNFNFKSFILNIYKLYATEKFNLKSIILKLNIDKFSVSPIVGNSYKEMLRTYYSKPRPFTAGFVYVITMGQTKLCGIQRTIFNLLAV